MQHIINIFVDEKLTSFRNMFASTFWKFHPEIDRTFQSALSLTKDEAGCYHFDSDYVGGPMDSCIVDEASRPNAMVNYFENLYSRKVTVATPGNHSMIVVIWVQLFSDKVFDIIKELAKKIKLCDANFNVELIGFTHQAVSCFIPNYENQLPPEIYRARFDNNIVHLRDIRDSFSSIRLVANRNIDNVALNLNEEALARICAEYSALMCKHYLAIHPTVLNTSELPFESFGISSILFDVDYYRTYIRNRIMIDKIHVQGIEKQTFNLNTLAQNTNPILRETQREISEFYNKQVIDAKARLDIDNNASASNIVGTIDNEIKGLINKLGDRIHKLLTSGEITLFESEALIALILGEDSKMFESSAVGADEIILDDIIHTSANFFIELDNGNGRLKEVSQAKLKDVRNQMRNIALANRHRKQRLDQLNSQKKESETLSRHLKGHEYNLNGIDYKVNLKIDTEPLEQTYEPHEVRTSSVDLRNSFLPIRNQRGQGSCASFAVSSVMEALSKQSNRYSPAFLYWTARERQGTTESDSGTSMYTNIKAATEKGICSEEGMPYNADTYTLSPSESAYEDALKCRITEAKTLNPKVGDIKSALADGFPVIVAVRIFDSFSDTVGGFVKQPSKEELKAAMSDQHATHAMVVCGFSENEKIFVVRNSWGTDFGDNGYCYIPYSYADKYFKQACIITELNNTQHLKLTDGGGVIKFDLNDRRIEGVILENQIEEDNYKLEELAAESERLKSDWTENIAILGNVNNQSEIVNKYKKKLDDKIATENHTIHSLQSSQGEKIRIFKKSSLKSLACIGGAAILSWIGIYFLYDYSWIYIVAGILTLLFVGVSGVYSFKWRKYRQDLRDEVTGHAEKISEIQRVKRSLDIKAHIHGSILTKMEEYRSKLLSDYNKLQLFNNQLVVIYNNAKQMQESMTPTVSYPFLAVLENDLLDRYYNTWKERLNDSLNWHVIFTSYSMDLGLSQLLHENGQLNDAVMRGLKHFTMKEYVAKSNQGKWQFLPDNSRLSEVIPDLDYRAKPFSPYKPKSEDMEEKYIFIKDINHDDMKDITPFFSKKPMPIATTDPYSISVLNIVRFDI